MEGSEALSPYDTMFVWSLECLDTSSSVNGCPPDFRTTHLRELPSDSARPCVPSRKTWRSWQSSLRSSMGVWKAKTQFYSFLSFESFPNIPQRPVQEDEKQLFYKILKQQVGSPQQGPHDMYFHCVQSSEGFRLGVVHRIVNATVRSDRTVPTYCDGDQVSFSSTTSARSCASWGAR